MRLGDRLNNRHQGIIDGVYGRTYKGDRLHVGDKALVQHKDFLHITTQTDSMRWL